MRGDQGTGGGVPIPHGASAGPVPCCLSPATALSPGLGVPRHGQGVGWGCRDPRCCWVAVVVVGHSAVPRDVAAGDSGHRCPRGAVCQQGHQPAWPRGCPTSCAAAVCLLSHSAVSPGCHQGATEPLASPGVPWAERPLPCHLPPLWPPRCPECPGIPVPLWGDARVTAPARRVSPRCAMGTSLCTVTWWQPACPDPAGAGVLPTRRRAVPA